MSSTTTTESAPSVPKKLESAGCYKNSPYSKYNSTPNSSPPPPQHLQQNHHHHPVIVTSSSSSCTNSNPSPITSHPGLLPIIGQPVNSMLAISGGLLPIDHFRLKLYNYAMAERLRCTGYPPGHGPPGQMPLCPQPLSVGGENPAQRVAAAAMMGQYGPGLALSMSLFQNRMFSSAEEPKPQHSYIGLIAMAILGAPDQKLVLSDIYQHILDNYPYFRSRGPGWRNSIRHNLSLNDCFVKAGRSANGKGHYWAVHPANVDDFKKGDFRRRKAQRKVRKHMGLAVDDAGTDSPSPPPMTDPFTSPWSIPHVPGMDLIATNAALYHQPPPPPPGSQTAHHIAFQLGQTTTTSPVGGHVMHQPTSVAFTDPFHQNLLQRHHQQLQMISSKLCSRKRQFDVASLLAPDEHHMNHQQHQQESQEMSAKRSYSEICSSRGGANEDSNEAVHQTTIIRRSSPTPTSDVEENIDVEANEIEEETDEESQSHGRESQMSPEINSYFTNTASSKFELRERSESPQGQVNEGLVKRRRVSSKDEEELDQKEKQQSMNRFSWSGVIPMQKSLAFDKTLLERYYGGQNAHLNYHQHHNNNHHSVHHQSAMEDANVGGEGKKCPQM